MFFVDRASVNCIGIERTVQECPSIMVPIIQANQVTEVNCTGQKVLSDHQIII